MMKRGAIYTVPLPLIIEALKARGVLPADGQCESHADALEIKVKSSQLPQVPEGALYARRVACAHYPLGRILDGDEA